MGLSSLGCTNVKKDTWASFQKVILQFCRMAKDCCGCGSYTRTSARGYTICVVNWLFAISVADTTFRFVTSILKWLKLSSNRHNLKTSEEHLHQWFLTFFLITHFPLRLNLHFPQLNWIEPFAISFWRSRKKILYSTNRMFQRKRTWKTPNLYNKFNATFVLW